MVTFHNIGHRKQEIDARKRRLPWHETAGAVNLVDSMMAIEW